MPMNIRVRSRVSIMRPRPQRLLLRLAVVVRHKPVRRGLLLRLAVSVAISIAIRLLLGRLPVRRWRAAGAAAAEGVVGGAHGAEVGLAGNELGARVGVRRRRGPCGVGAAGARVASATVGGGGHGGGAA
uniref:Uncharacterized protein n=1 Tax=Arundo donax TaxID=35708 RepID=A0A0A9DXU3_ARUDO